MRILFYLVLVLPLKGAFAQLPDSTAQPTPCPIALDTLDEFDSTRLIATQPIPIGFLVPTRNLTAELEGETLTEEAKALFSYAESTDNVRSFFLTLVVTEHKVRQIEPGMNVFLKFDNGQVYKLYNVPDRGELNRDIIMWLYQHTCVVPLEIYHLMKFAQVEKIRINYKGYKRTIALEPDQRKALQDAVLCVEQRLRQGLNLIKP